MTVCGLRIGIKNRYFVSGYVSLGRFSVTVAHHRSRAFGYKTAWGIKEGFNKGTGSK